MIKCPHCGSTQTKQLIGYAYTCECGELFYMVNNKPKTATQICEEINRAEQKPINDRIKCPNCGSTKADFCESYSNHFNTCEKSYACGCGCDFTVTFQAVDVKIDYLPQKNT